MDPRHRWRARRTRPSGSLIDAFRTRQDYRKLAANPDGFRELARKLIALETEPMAWEADVKNIKAPVLHTRDVPGGLERRAR